MEMNLMKKKFLIGTVLSALVLCIIGIFIYTQYSKPADASEVVHQPYTGHQIEGYEDILNRSSNFDMGLNKYGEPIFVDRDKAYKQLLVTCKEGIEATQEKGDLPEISKHNLGAYSSVSMEVTDETYNQETVHQAAFIGIFYAFYCHGDDR